MPLAYEVASALHAPLDVFTVSKLGVRGYEELAMGAVASGGVYVLNRELLDAPGIDPEQFADIVRPEAFVAVL